MTNYFNVPVIVWPFSVPSSTLAVKVALLAAFTKVIKSLVTSAPLTFAVNSVSLALWTKLIKVYEIEDPVGLPSSTVAVKVVPSAVLTAVTNPFLIIAKLLSFNFTVTSVSFASVIQVSIVPVISLPSDNVIVTGLFFAASSIAIPKSLVIVAVVPSSKETVKLLSPASITSSISLVIVSPLSNFNVKV
jgi:hypothetical protein